MKNYRRAIYYWRSWCSCLILLFIVVSSIAQKQKVWVDADTGNETDDMYALARLLADPSIELVGVSSAHFNNADLVAFEKWNQYDTKNINTVNISQQLNEELLGVMHKLYIPHPLGSDRQIGRAWGGKEARPSAATQAIISAVKELAKNEKLIVVSLGALTNIASAIILDTTIAPKIICYALGAGYNIKKGYWNKNEFNIRNDLNAFDYLLNNKAVDLVIMPIDIAKPYRFSRDELYKTLRDESVVEKLLKQRWQETNPQDSIRTLWDLALVQAILKPELATIQQVLAPPENEQRPIKIYAGINVQAMRDDFFGSLKSYKGALTSKNWPAPGGKIRVIIDADAANEVDDQWAIALTLGFPERFQIEGFVAAHYGDRGGKMGIDKSYNSILEVLEYAGMKGKFPVKKGSNPILYKDQINESEGVDFIIEKAKTATPENPIWIFVLGAATDAAMALLKDPGISDKIIVFWHGRTSWPHRCWNFNATNDIKAVQILFEKCKRFILFDTGTFLNMPMEESEKRISTNGKLGEYLHNIRKKSKYAQEADKGFFDLGDIAALLDDSIIKWENTYTPTVGDDYRYIFNNTSSVFTRIYAIEREPSFKLLDEALIRIENNRKSEK